MKPKPLRIVSAPTPAQSLADEVATYLQTEREQAARKARIIATARAQARARGEWGVIDFHRILHGSKTID